MKPIAIIDLESTGKDIVKDRIIEIAISKFPEGLAGPFEKRHFFFNPQIPISQGAIEVHGITNEFIASKPKFEEYARSLFVFLMGCDIAGFNSNRFDVPMLSEEFGRCGISWPAESTRFLDACIVFKAKERRDLSAALKFYTGQDHILAHGAPGDVDATHQVLIAQMAAYPELADVRAFASFCDNPKALDLAGKIELNEDGIAVYAFGKDKGKSVKEFPDFGRWMLKPEQCFPTNTKNIVKSLISNQ